MPKPNFDDKFEIEATVYVDEDDSGAVNLTLGFDYGGLFNDEILESHIYSASIDWGDDSIIYEAEVNEKPDVAHIYKSSGTYKVKITGKGLCTGLIFDGGFKNIDISKCPQCQLLRLDSNRHITSFKDIVGIERVRQLETNVFYQHEVTTFSITNLNGLEKAADLTDLYLRGCSLLTSADLRNFRFLKRIELNEKNLKSLNMESNTAIERLDIFGNGSLTSLDLSGCTSLSHLDCTNSNFISINAEDSDLEYLYCPINIESIAIKSISIQITIGNNKLSEENLNYIYKRLKDRSGEKYPGAVAYKEPSDIKGNTYIATARNWEFSKLK